MKRGSDLHNLAGLAPPTKAVHCADPCTRNIDHVEENLGALNVQLTAENLREIETGLAAITVYGGRLNEMQMELVDRTA